MERKQTHTNDEIEELREERRRKDLRHTGEDHFLESKKLRLRPENEIAAVPFTKTSTAVLL